MWFGYYPQIIFVTFLANYTQALFLSKYIDSWYLVRTTPTICLLLDDSSFNLKNLDGDINSLNLLLYLTFQIRIVNIEKIV